MPTNGDRVLAYLTLHPEGQDDDQIGAALGIDRIQINAICRRLAASSVIRRSMPPTGGKILNQPLATQGAVTVLPISARGGGHRPARYARRATHMAHR